MVRPHNPSEVPLCRSDYVLLCKARSARYANARGSGGMPFPRQILKNRCCEIESECILESIYLAIQCVLTCKINVKLSHMYL